MWRHSSSMDMLLCNFYEKSITEDDWGDLFYKYWNIEGRLLCEVPFFTRWLEKYELTFGEHMESEYRSADRYGDKTYKLCNMGAGSGTSRYFDPTKFLFQNHEELSNRCAAYEELQQLVVRRFYLSFISVAGKEVHDTVQCKQILQTKIDGNDGVWSAPATPWEEYLAIFFILKNEFIRYENATNGTELREHTFSQMRIDWMPYRSSMFCQRLWEYYEGEPDKLLCWSEEIKGKPVFDDTYNICEIYCWVEWVLDNVEWMENALPPISRTDDELRDD